METKNYIETAIGSLVIALIPSVWYLYNTVWGSSYYKIQLIEYAYGTAKDLGEGGQLMLAVFTVRFVTYFVISWAILSSVVALIKHLQNTP
mgnify:CR=1 FL=1